MKLDLKDQKLLFLLSKDSRMGYAELGKLAGISRDSAEYRINRLIENAVIKGFKTSIDYRELGYEEYDLYLKLSKASQQSVERIIHKLCNHPFVTWVGTCFGDYDLRVSVLAKNNQQLNATLRSIESELSNQLQETEIVTVIKKYKIHPESLIHSLFPDLKGFKVPQNLLYSEKSAESEQEALDNKDLEILKTLGKNSRESLVNISKRAGITPEAVKYRIRKLEKSSIKKYTIAIDGTKLGKIWSVFLFKLQNANEELEGEIEKFILSSKNTTASVKLLGKWNWGITVYANDMKEIQKILFEIRNRFSDNIQEYKLLVIFDTYKYPAVAEGVLTEQNTNR